MRIAIDIDDTLWKLVKDEDPNRISGVGAMCACGMHVKQELDETMVSLVDELIVRGHSQIFLWSAGGVEYAKDWIKRLKPDWEHLVEVLPKEKGHNIDICIDDQEVNLATILLRIKRPHADHWNEENKLL